MDEQIKNHEGDITVFIDSCPLGCTWPSEVILLGRDHIYRNKPQEVHAEKKFLDALEQDVNDEEEQEFIIFLNFSPCNECATKICRFLTDHSEVTFEIAFAHVYTGYRHANREGLKKLHDHKRITLRALRGEDWKKIIRLILEAHGWDGWDDAWQQIQPNLEDWEKIKREIEESIGGQQGDDWKEEFRKKIQHKPWPSHWLQDLEEIITRYDHNEWAYEVGELVSGSEDVWYQAKQNEVMQYVYNYGRDSVSTILNHLEGPDNEENRTGYAFLLHVLEILGKNRPINKLRKRIVADYVARKELEYILQKQAQAQAGAAAQAL
ncbi:uncharacterized protein LOC110975557 [Acanthaster planci]|uniref:Uncharacterized protein LOC110975557 n=1 Tax=Acanthaster planci TaxID=133434 RepID=A0A8B7XVC6_ACAPL|nr:uncharacterized protein LOC110975557 [Acanthaster planci]